jgi:beta-glucosidase
VRRMRSAWLVLVLACGLAACGSSGSPLENEINSLLAQMTLEEKVAQMAGHGQPETGVELWEAPGLARLGIPMFRMSDGPRGVTQVPGATTFPVGMARGASWEPDLELRVGEAMGKELRASGGNVLLAPTINILNHPSWGRSQETYGEDVHHLSAMGVAFVKGAQRFVLANPKHYAANNIEDTRFNVDVTVDERTLREIYLPHFRAVVQQGGAASVMSAYNSVNGQYCSENEPLLREILKNEWGFDGFVLSDWYLATHETIKSVVGGLDLEMPAPKVYGEPLLRAVRDGTVSESLIDDAVRRMLRKKLEFNLAESSPVGAEVIASEEHLALAREAAVKGAVLLKNDGEALPLAVQTMNRIVVIGELSDFANLGDRGSSNPQPAFSITPLEGITEAVAGSVAIDHIDSDEILVADHDMISSADAAIVVTGLTYNDEGEGLIAAGDREDLALSAERQALIDQVASLNNRTVVVLEGGGAITMGGWLSEVEAVLMVWYPGQLGGHAIADLLFGAANPSGKLPITFPADLGQLPPFDNVSHAITYGYFHGYRHIDRESLTPLFPFGFGLSYTTFRYDSLELSATDVRATATVTVTVTVTNTGAVDGAEVVQVYVSYPGSSVMRAERELKGFSRLELAAGETRGVEIAIPAASLAYYDTTSGGWVVEALDYEIRAGASSRDLPLEATLSVR